MQKVNKCETVKVRKQTSL